ncbi:MAG: hypothetical protein E7388_02975 [Ruminococcaceae bacterium]|nr:hypothetical protein [Oscillospiraceae bacterium]
MSEEIFVGTDTDQCEETAEENEGVNLGEILSLLDTYKEITEEIKNDERAAFIKAIKPYLTQSQQMKAEKCLKILSLSRFLEHKEAFSKVGSKFLPT